MNTQGRRHWRSALLGAFVVGGMLAVAPQALASEAHPTPEDHTEAQVLEGAQTTPFTPECFGEPATIIMTTPGDQEGTAGDDVIIGTSGDDFIDSLGGRDRICAGDGVDRISADRDDGWGVIVIGQDPNADDDFIDGQDDGDVITPGSGNDFVWGSDGNDYLYGQLGDDTIYGGPKQDWMDCDEGRDYADGGLGSNDWVNPTHGCETLISAAP